MRKCYSFFSILVLSGCGMVGNTVISDASLQSKAAFALNTTADKVTISHRQAGLDDIRFTANIGKKQYQCYITTVAGVISSDAVCSRTTGNKKRSCNALEKAANRC
ncbi:hypothetical protein [Gallibacterium genomosp. 1]|uniref:Lipoprotein n=1 Tax=Gallibacterium genomosp. 1 TaxID=155515 RepID=A0A0A2YAF7_9PAST|nr:hypothetical protein [Gallibacterium genomosp. 1]KGQ39595.1 hypothetical protein JP36_00050 [Gallibacterium genomosp. 1]